MILFKSSQIWKPKHSLLQKETFTVLFPEWDDKEIPGEFAQNYLRGIAAGQTNNQMAMEYAQQCHILGERVYSKIQAGQELQSWFIALFCLLAVETASVLVCVVNGFISLC
jgi:hypothetical protein